MKTRTYIIILLCSAFAGMVCSCSGNQYLTNQQISSERVRVVQYYNNRSEGFPFRSGFYQVSDSIFATVPDGDRRSFEIIYGRIQSKRADDSTGRIRDIYFKVLAGELDNDFDHANSGRE